MDNRMQMGPVGSKPNVYANRPPPQRPPAEAAAPSHKTWLIIAIVIVVIVAIAVVIIVLVVTLNQTPSGSAGSGSGGSQTTTSPPPSTQWPTVKPSVLCQTMFLSGLSGRFASLNHAFKLTGEERYGRPVYRSVEQSDEYIFYAFAGWYVGLKSDTDHAPGVISMDYAPRPDQVLRPWTTYNGSHDVPDYKIEAFCGDCPAGYFLCVKPSQCIPAEKRCSGVQECGDGSDESGCSCSSNQFTCLNGACVDATKKCNSQNDCTDGSDENNCAGSSLSCTFEGGLCGYTQSNIGSFRWTVRKGTSQSQRTGPPSDHTTQASTGTYMYADASGAAANKVATLTSVVGTSSQARCLSFYFYMYGANVGRLEVEGLSWSMTGDKGQKWYLARVAMPTSVSKVIFKATATGSGYRGDIAIDDVKVTNGACPATSCGSGAFTCGTQCIPSSKRCDQVYDCLDKSDEQSCQKVTFLNVTGSQLVPEVMSMYKYDAGLSGSKPVYKNVWGGIYVSYNTTNNRWEIVKGYGSSYDTMYCLSTGNPPAFPQDVSEWECLNIHTQQDEVDPDIKVLVPYCEASQFQCKIGACVPLSDVCDTEDDCTDNSDEVGCACRADQFRCSNGKCIQNEVKCDGTNDCPNGEDEQGCKVGTCQLIQSSLCNNVGYGATAFPNLIGETSAADAATSAAAYQQATSGCDVALETAFVCSMTMPKCINGNVNLKPCKSFCTEFKTKCTTSAAALQNVDCNILPDSTDPTKCYNPNQGSCQPIDVPECVGLGYTTTLFPSYAATNNQYESSQKLTGLVKDLDKECTYQYRRLFACSLLLPKCSGTQKLPPCKSLCDGFMAQCSSTLSKHGISVSCSNYPSTQCVGTGDAGTSNIECGTKSDKFTFASPYIINSQLAQEGEFPYQISLRQNADHICGGTLISTQWIVTAAHCIESKDPSEYEVLVGATNRQYPGSNGQLRQVSYLKVHENYDTNSKTLPNDIAMMKLSSPVTLNDYVRLACMPTPGQQFDLTSHCFLTGWGLIKDGADSPVMLREAKMKLWSTERCNRKESFDNEVDGNLKVCAGFDAGLPTACSGDSGGPLVCLGPNNRWTLVGAVSYGAGVCGLAYKGTVFTRITGYLNWINNVMATQP